MEKHPTSSDKLRRSLCDGGDCLETAFMEEKLVLAVSGHLQLFDFKSVNDHNLKKNQQTRRQINAALEIG